MPAAVVRRHSGTGRRQSPLRPSSGRHQSPWPRRPPAHTARSRAYLRRRRIRSVIPDKTDQAANRKTKGALGGRPVGHDRDLYKDRNTVERSINKIKERRGLATRYGKSPASYLAGHHLRGAVIWLHSLPPAT